MKKYPPIAPRTNPIKIMDMISFLPTYGDRMPMEKANTIIIRNRIINIIPVIKSIIINSFNNFHINLS
jgi:hypothetical protein